MEIVDMLRNSELFKGFDNGHLKIIATYCIGNSYDKDTVIFKEGEKATDLYVLTDGRVLLEMEVRPVANLPAISTAVETIAPGGVFGWSSIVEPNIYTRSARCLTNCTALAIKGDMLSKVINDDPVFGLELMKRLAALISIRLLNTRLRLVNVIGVALLDRGAKAQV